MAFPNVDLVSIRRLILPTAAFAPSRKIGRMLIAAEGQHGTVIVAPYAPQEVSHDNLGAEYVKVPRPGLPSIDVYSNESSPTMTFTLLVADKAIGGSRFGDGSMVTAISVIQTLREYARKGTRVRVTYGLLESGLWYIGAMSLSSVRRHPTTDEITHAAVELTFITASSVVIGIGPLTGGVQPPAAAPAPPKPPQKTSARYYKFKRGDTLWGVSIKHYGTGTKWRVIADANGIKDPRKIPVGKVVRIP